MEAVPYQLAFDAEVALLIGQTRVRCRCGYTLGDLDQPRCPECGHGVTLRDIGDYGTTEETATALRLQGPIPCGACGETIIEPDHAACPACHTRIKLSWFPAYARGRPLQGRHRAALILGALGVVAQVIPAAALFASHLEPLLFIPVVVTGAWLWAAWRSRRDRKPPLPDWALAAGPWAAVLPVLTWMIW